MAWFVDISKLFFSVSDDRSVNIHYGPLQFSVCSDPRDFQDFIDKLFNELNSINAEMLEDYPETGANHDKSR